MSSIGKRLLATTADLAASIEARSAQGEAGKAPLPRTAPGQMLAARSEMLAMQTELQALREKLKAFDGSLPTVRIDPALIDATRWANRHPSAFTTAAFARLKSSIELAGGNAQPILVRRTEDGARYEIVFGHRRHRACLELALPVLAVVWDGPMPDLDLFLSMDRENREREDPSAYEQGITYLAALDAGLFPSQRRLAEAIGVSHTWVRKATLVAQLPAAIVETFATPLDIQPRHAEELQQALDQDRKTVLRRAENVRRMSRRPSPGQIVAQLVGRATEKSVPEKFHVGGRLAGGWKRDNRGRAVLTLEAHVANDAFMAELSDALVKLLRKLET
ncbi:ParB/RepB/Spo0J family partition protein [Azohydromonas caseinilytica]|uniref:ParB/RepB/Spo0J family partition protein n=1 Tax=Azohydromonas caseinilytica TaxID=2728836 RepID=A0A848FCV1_9BURK|nr:ParB/RepB/Spo0J family partition protein [Azohydromonas caseinilytica]NML15990.1 ParB/RepB/Spo0J family partition protein [Azohydromonas caseinilytica]